VRSRCGCRRSPGGRSRQSIQFGEPGRIHAGHCPGLFLALALALAAKRLTKALREKAVAALRAGPRRHRVLLERLEALP
jgi:hypothetical protein